MFTKDLKKRNQKLVEELRACRRRVAELEEAAEAARRDADRPARDSEEPYRVLAEASPDMIFVIGRDDEVRYVNPVAAERFGADPDDIVGAPREELFPPQVSAGQRESLQRVLQTGEKVHAEGRVAFPEGEAWLSTWLVPISRGGEVEAVLGISRDISERKQAESRLEGERSFSEALISSLPGVFYLFDADGRLVRWNRNFGDVTGYSDEELAQMTPTDFFQGDDQERVAESVNRVFAEGQAKVEADFVGKSGETTPYLFTGVLMELQGDPYLGGIGIDISERKAMEEDLRYHREHLQEMVEARTKTIQQQAEEILELSTPVLEVMDRVVVLPLIGTLDSQRAQRLTEVLLQRIEAADAEVALIDITGVPTIDTQTAQHLIEAVAAARLLGARVVLTGVRPSIAQSLVHLGIDLSDLITRASLAAGLRVAKDLVR